MILESSPANLLEYMVFLWLGQAIFEIFGWSRLAELGARYSHLEGSSQKVEDVNNKLRLKYFKVRHQLIDRSMCELFAAQSVYGNR